MEVEIGFADNREYGALMSCRRVRLLSRLKADSKTEMSCGDDLIRVVLIIVERLSMYNLLDL